MKTLMSVCVTSLLASSVAVTAQENPMIEEEIVPPQEETLPESGSAGKGEVIPSAPAPQDESMYDEEIVPEPEPLPGKEVMPEEPAPEYDSAPVDEPMPKDEAVPDSESMPEETPAPEQEEPPADED